MKQNIQCLINIPIHNNFKTYFLFIFGQNKIKGIREQSSMCFQRTFLELATEQLEKRTSLHQHTAYRNYFEPSTLSLCSTNNYEFELMYTFILRTFPFSIHLMVKCESVAAYKISAHFSANNNK